MWFARFDPSFIVCLTVDYPVILSLSEFCLSPSISRLQGTGNCWLQFSVFFTGPQPKAGTGLRMQTVLFFNVTLLGIYRWLRYIAGSLKSYPPFWKERGMEDSQEKDYSFLGNDTFPNLYDALVYERKFKSEYLERQIYERSLKSEPSIVKLIEKLSEPSIVKFIENQSKHLSKFVFKKISMIDIPKSSKSVSYTHLTLPTKRIV